MVGSSALAARQDRVEKSRRKPRRLRTRLTDVPDALFVIPIVFLVTVVILVPTGTAIFYSFTNWNPGYASPFLGLSNYIQLVKSPIFHEILVNQLYLLLGIPLWVVLPLVGAFVLHARVPARGLFRTIFFFPSTASPALIGILFVSVLAPGGPLDAALGSIGIHSPPDWLVDAAWVKPVLIGVLAWATLGIGLVIFSAGLSAVSPELFEAARLDGASWWQELRHVVMPGLAKLIELWVIILVIIVFTGMFPWVYSLTMGGPGYSSTTIDYSIWQNSLTFGYFGLAAAEMVIMLGFIAVILVLGKVLFTLLGRRYR
jgi:ABC-type sugar transport system permease subunit